MLPIDLRGKRALVAGVADDNGFGWAIAKHLIEAGATVCVATWPPALNIFLNLLERGKMDESRKLPDGTLLNFEKIYPLDAAFDRLEDAPAEIRENRRYRERGDFTIEHPTGSGQQLRLADVAQELSRRLVSIWLPGADGRVSIESFSGSIKVMRA